MSREQTKNEMPTASSDATEKTEPCRYCKDKIPIGALICKSCLERQDFRGRTMRSISTSLASLVALASLGIGYLQYKDAKQANVEAAIAQSQLAAATKSENDAQEASLDLLKQVYAKLSTEQQSQLQASAGPITNDLQSLQTQIKINPNNIRLRSQLLLRQVAMPPNQ